jgi:hypothetical protein
LSGAESKSKQLADKGLIDDEMPEVFLFDFERKNLCVHINSSLFLYALTHQSRTINDTHNGIKAQKIKYGALFTLFKKLLIDKKKKKLAVHMFVLQCI